MKHMKRTMIAKRRSLCLAASLGILISVTLAGPVMAESPDTVHLGKSEVSKEQVIKLLAPEKKPTLLTRGIRVHGEDDPAAMTENSKPDPKSLSLEIYFEFNSAQLSPEAVEQLSPVGEALQSNELSGLAFTLEGHTDATGDENYNLTLSEKRAASVKQFFIENFSLSPDRLKAEGKGESELIEGTPPDSGINRRVTIIAQ